MEEILSNFFMITLPMPFRMMHTHVFIAISDDKVALFDTGLNIKENFLIFEESLKSINKKVEDVENIFITHFHIDHCGMAGRIKDISGAKIHMSEFSQPFISRRANELAYAKMVKDFCLRNGLSEEAAGGIAKLFLDFKESPAPFQIDRYYRYNQRYRAGDRHFEAMPTPGHSHDHVSFYFPEEQILLSGDHVLPDISPNISPDLFSPEFMPLHSFIESLSLVQNLTVKKVYPAHGSPFANLAGRVEELKEHHRVRKELIRQSVMPGPKNAFQVSRDIFGGALPEFDRFLALNETFVHLSQLAAEGSLRELKQGSQIYYTAAED